jgi:hypothetical protein
MIRLAALGDIARLRELFMEMYRASEYPARDVGVSEPALQALLRDAVIRNGRTNDGGALVNVAEKDGEIVGFMIGTLQRVYCVGNRLEAQDMFLYCTPEAPARASARLIDAYLRWALSNPKVADVALSWTDVAGVDGEKIERLYASRGFKRRGAIWKRVGQ